MIKVNDMDSVEAWSGDTMLGLGIHNVRIEDAHETTSTGGHDQVELKLVSLTGGGSIRDWLTFPKDDSGQVNSFALGRAKMVLNAVMIEPKGGEWTFPTEQLVGKTCQINVIEEPKWDDPTKTRKTVASYDLLNADPIRPDERDLPGTTAVGASDDDIPF